MVGSDGKVSHDGLRHFTVVKLVQAVDHTTVGRGRLTTLWLVARLLERLDKGGGVPD